MSKKKDDAKPSTLITNCTFTGVSWDKDAVAVLNDLVLTIRAESTGAATRATALADLAKSFAARDVAFECLLKVVDGEPSNNTFGVTK